LLPHFEGYFVDLLLDLPPLPQLLLQFRNSSLTGLELLPKALDLVA
jgi:hypothetical protein